MIFVDLYIYNYHFYRYEFLNRQVEICHSLWLPIRYQTIDELVRNKDEVMGIIHVAAAAAGVALTYLGVATGLGLLLAPFTFGSSLAVAAAAAGAGVAAGGLAIGGMPAMFASRVLSNRCLKAAQEHIFLDQQLSLQNNEVASRLMNSGSQLNVVASQMETTAAMASVVETSAAANRTALAGGSFVVTVPIDISSIAYQIYQSSKDKTEKNKWFLDQAEELLKGI